MKLQSEQLELIEKQSKGFQRKGNKFFGDSFKIEKKIEKIDSQINDILEATKLKEEAKELFLEIEKIADDKIEKTICINKKIAINSLSKQIQSFSQPQKRKKSSSINQTKQNKTYTGLNTDEDGNIALKCNWNDKNYCEPCSNEAYEYNCSIVSCQLSSVGYRRDSFIRASLAVNCQFTLAFLLFLTFCHALASFLMTSISSILRSMHWPVSTFSSISAIFSQLPCFGV